MFGKIKMPGKLSLNLKLNSKILGKSMQKQNKKLRETYRLYCLEDHHAITLIFISLTYYTTVNAKVDGLSTSSINTSRVYRCGNECKSLETMHQRQMEPAGRSGSKTGG